MTIAKKSNKHLVVIQGPTATGKSGVAVELAKRFGTEVISCDSRQFYREIPVGTAAPSIEEQGGVIHHFIASRGLEEDYSAGRFAEDALRLIDELFEKHDVLFLVGGSGLYINAVCDGMDDIPECDPTVREQLQRQFLAEGIDALCEELKQTDAEYYNQVDLNNPQRIIRALEIIRTTGKSYSSFRKGERQARSFDAIKVGLTMSREVLYDRINRRVDLMMTQGLEAEVRAVYHLKHINALQTVGYSEIFDYIDGVTTLDEAVGLIKRNSRRYAKRQFTWFRRDASIRWFEVDDECVNGVENFIREFAS